MDLSITRLLIKRNIIAYMPKKKRVLGEIISLILNPIPFTCSMRIDLPMNAMSNERIRIPKNKRVKREKKIWLICLRENPSNRRLRACSEDFAITSR